MPTFESCCNMDGLYLDWKLEVNAIFLAICEKVWVAISRFFDCDSIWLDDYCRLYPDYIPTT